MSDSARVADVIVIGGGVAGLSTAWQLAERGKRVTLLERARLGAGSTGRAAGLLGQLRGTRAATRMLMDAVEIVRELESRTGLEVFVRTGSLRVAATEERAGEIRDLVAMGESIGFQISRIPRDEVARLLPYMRTDDIIEACFSPTDGHLQPAELTAAYRAAGRRKGVEFVTECPVERVIVRNGKACGVSTPRGEFEAPVVVNATGPWSYLLAERSETRVATAALQHVYLTTRPIDDVPVDRLSPAVRDRQLRIYSRPEAGGLIVGMYEAEPVLEDMSRLPADFDMSTMKAARDDLAVALLIHEASQRFPWIDARTPMTITKGIMTFTPDGKPVCGRLPDIEGLYHCAGFSGHGIVQSPTIGVIMAEWIVDGETKYDVDALEADRFFDIEDYRSRAGVERACVDMYGSYYGRIERVRAP